MQTINRDAHNSAPPGFGEARHLSRLVLPLTALEELRTAELEIAIARQDEQDSMTNEFDDYEPSPLITAETPPKKCNPSQKWSRALFQISQVEEILKRVSKGVGGRSDRSEYIKKTCTELLANGANRQLTRPKRNWKQRLLNARVNFPNGAEFFDFIAAQLIMAEHAGRPVVVPPLCLVGAPGVGKSTLVELVAEILNRPLHRIQVEIGGHASTLVGTEAHWSSSGPGLLFTALATGSSINPILMLDELEKVQKREDYPNLHKVLYSLLENASAKKFVDLSIPDLQIDASFVQWIGTANSLDGIPDAILSRMRVLEIPPLTEEQSIGVLKRVDSVIRKELKIQAWPPLNSQVMNLLCSESPRRMWQKIREAYGKAMIRGEREVLICDFSPPAEMRSKEEPQLFNSLQDMLTLTTYSSLRALELQSQLALAQRIWEDAEASRTVH